MGGDAGLVVTGVDDPESGVTVVAGLDVSTNADIGGSAGTIDAVRDGTTVGSTATGDRVGSLIDESVGDGIPVTGEADEKNGSEG